MGMITFLLIALLVKVLNVNIFIHIYVYVWYVHIPCTQD